jgi:hypothetical protein
VQDIGHRQLISPSVQQRRKLSAKPVAQAGSRTVSLAIRKPRVVSCNGVRDEVALAAEALQGHSCTPGAVVHRLGAAADALLELFGVFAQVVQQPSSLCT